MTAGARIEDLRGLACRDGILSLNNASARETSPLTAARLDELIEAASLALFVSPARAFVIAFAASDRYDGGHFQWFRRWGTHFLYVDRVVVSGDARREGLGQALYAEVFRCARSAGCTHVTCEVNVVPPNPASDRFHDRLGFVEVGRGTMDGGAKTVRYLAANVSP